MLKKRGIEDVSHLSGGIHRYVEQYGQRGFWKGKVFVFDQRVALDPTEMASGTAKREEEQSTEELDGNNNGVVGKCLECHTPYDEISGSILCTVCRDLVLICPTCRTSLHEYHCERHSKWKGFYYTFLERFTTGELRAQHGGLKRIHDATDVQQKNVRRTLRKQIDKVLARVKALDDGTVKVERNARRRCRTCYEPSDVCDGLCWGFWKNKNGTNGELEPILDIKVGDRVRPGPDWNELRLGSQFYSDEPSCSGNKMRKLNDSSGQSQSIAKDDDDKILKVGTVIDINSPAGLATVVWDERRESPTVDGVTIGSKEKISTRQKTIYRWGNVARNGKRMYDVELLS